MPSCETRVESAHYANHFRDVIPKSYGHWKRQKESVITHRLEAVAVRQSKTVAFVENELRAYTIPIGEVFRSAAKDNPHVRITPGVMAGAPCIANTRIPVYMVLDAFEHYGTIEGTMQAYPRLTKEQIEAALRFAKTIVECPIVE